MFKGKIVGPTEYRTTNWGRLNQLETKVPSKFSNVFKAINNMNGSKDEIKACISITCILKREAISIKNAIQRYYGKEKYEIEIGLIKQTEAYKKKNPEYVRYAVIIKER